MATLAVILAGCQFSSLSSHQQPRPLEHRVTLDRYGSAVDLPEPLRRLVAVRQLDPCELRAAPGTEAAFESPIITPGIRFSEAAPSWNLDVPEGAAVWIDIRVGTVATPLASTESGLLYETKWSPWLRVGTAGAPPPSKGESTWTESGVERARVDIDILRSDFDFTHAQYRVSCRSETTRPLTLQVRQFGVCVSGTPDPSLQAPGTHGAQPLTLAPVTIAVPFRSQRVTDPSLAGRLCSPTSTSMVLAYRQRPVSVEQFSAAAYDPDAEIYGNWPRNIQAAYQFGVPGFLMRFSDWDSVHATLATGQPIVASIAAEPGELRRAPYDSTDGHLIVLRGFDERGDLLVSDPACGTAREGELTYSRRDLTRVWMERGAGTAYILLPARAHPPAHSTDGPPD